MSKATTRERIDVRVPPAAKKLLKQAAAVSHKTVTEFLLHHGLNAASHTLADRRLFELDDAKWAQFQAVLDRPVQRKPKLKRLLSGKTVLER